MSVIVIGLGGLSVACAWVANDTFCVEVDAAGTGITQAIVTDAGPDAACSFVRPVTP